MQTRCNNRTLRCNASNLLDPCTRPLWQTPWLAHDFTFTEGPEVHANPHQVIDARVRGLIQQQRRQCRKRIDDQPHLHGAVHDGAGHPGSGPFPPQRQDAEEEIDNLQDGEGFDGAVEVGG